ARAHRAVAVAAPARPADRGDSGDGGAGAQLPGREISYKEYGPEPRDFYQKVQAELGGQGRGSLAVDVDDERTVVFVNERYAGVGDVKVTDLYPGRDRVLGRQGDSLGRVHLVGVEPGATATLALSWEFDSSLRTGRTAWLEFPDEAARAEAEARMAVRVARSVGA